MTFIIALQLKDSIVVTADKKVVVISEEKQTALTNVIH